MGVYAMLFDHILDSLKVLPDQINIVCILSFRC